MPITPSTVLRPVLRLSADAFPKMAAARFGAQEDMDRTWHTFEPVARTLVDSFYLTIDHPGFEDLVPRLDAVAPELRGIAYEGAGMGLMLLDSLVPTRDRLRAFAAGPGARYRSLLYIGAGLVLPRLPRSTMRYVARQDPMLRWFVLDGYGFYLGFFRWRQTVNEHRVPRPFGGYAARAFDQGLGRSLWFSTGANVERIIDTVQDFPANRQVDLWSGIGLACAYAAGVMDRSAIERLVEAAGPCAGDLAVGAAVASVFRAESGDPAPHSELACDVIWGEDCNDVAEFAQRALPADPQRLGDRAYADWRLRLRGAWSQPGARPSRTFTSVHSPSGESR